MYSDVVMDHFSNPRNVGEIEPPTEPVRSAIRPVATSCA